MYCTAKLYLSFTGIKIFFGAPKFITRMYRQLTWILLLSSICSAGASGQQSFDGQWTGIVFQKDQPDTFRYEAVIQVKDNAVTGNACSTLDNRGIRACFELTGLIKENQLLLQEWRQTEPEVPKWCLKQITLKPATDGALSGSWTAKGCQPGLMVLRKAGARSGVEEIPFTIDGRWVGQLSQSDRNYGFFYELELRPDGTGASRIDSEASGGTATLNLSWQADESGNKIRITESGIATKTDPKWRWCIKDMELDLRREGGRFILSGGWEGFIEGYTLESGPCAPGNIYLEKPVMTREINESAATFTLPYQQTEKREVKIDRILKVSKPDIRLKVWDNGTVDGDVVTLYLNGERILKNFKVTKRKWSIPVKLTQKNNFLILHAEDLGDITPNTVAVSIDDGVKEEIIILSSNLQESGAILIQPFVVD